MLCIRITDKTALYTCFNLPYNPALHKPRQKLNCMCSLHSSCSSCYALLTVSFFCAPAAVNLRCCSNPIKAFVGHYGLTSCLTEHEEATSGHRKRAHARCYLWWCDVKALTGGMAVFSLPERRLLGGNWQQVINYLFFIYFLTPQKRTLVERNISRNKVISNASASKFSAWQYVYTGYVAGSACGALAFSGDFNYRNAI